MHIHRFQFFRRIYLILSSYHNLSLPSEILLTNIIVQLTYVTIDPNVGVECILFLILLEILVLFKIDSCSLHQIPFVGFEEYYFTTIPYFCRDSTKRWKWLFQLPGFIMSNVSYYHEHLWGIVVCRSTAAVSVKCKLYFYKYLQLFQWTWTVHIFDILSNKCNILYIS